ncbi:acyl carrier protein [Microseira wollei]|uniref:Phosphopantetheine-binding protein n=1 Tax=Microseira wollei NIES-4236 TaxID=2530354 RepID=A0AAV3XH71_9CYAN|nr:acyl carrier protein [Microseira wollei]GET40858.1 putative phosphopantetheine-binding protein [Microseira wollei NIES-4236]
MSKQKTKPENRSAAEIQEWLISWLSKELEIEASKIALKEEFVNLGVSSRQAVILTGELEDWLGMTLEPSLAWEYPSIQKLSEYLAETITQ